MITKNKNLFLMLVTVLSVFVLSGCSPKLTDIETEGIKYIYEVEKVARDVYKHLYDKFGTPILNSVSQSEQQHMDIMKELIDKYKLDDPAKDNDYGEFDNSELQELYHDLIEQGTVSETAALSIAAMIEEFDIVDINKYIDQTNKKDIISAYEKLTKGSDNHLRLFVSNLKAKGVEYQPQYLSKEDFNQSVAFTTTQLTQNNLLKMAYYGCPTFECGYVYNPNYGDPTVDIKPGTPFEDLPDDWVCPQCGAPKLSFYLFE